MKGLVAGLSGAVGAISLLCFALGPLLAHFRLVPAQAGFLVFALGMLLGVPAAVSGLVIAARSGFGPAAGLALLGALPALFLIYSLVSARSAPMINDVSTDTVYPPAFVEAPALPANHGRDMAFPERNRAIMREAYADIQPLAMPGTVDDVFANAMELARDQAGWEITVTRITDKESEFEGHATSAVFGFVDDFVVRVTRAEGGGCVVDMRSKSRDGKGDLGANAARIRAFFQRLRS